MAISDLKPIIDRDIVENTSQSITGTKLNEVLTAIVEELELMPVGVSLTFRSTGITITHKDESGEEIDDFTIAIPVVDPTHVGLVTPTHLTKIEGVGNLADLETTDKSSLVAAINELARKVNSR